jgi:phospholipid/cholesterol/gamma-HCH transport system ATP-binding protein
MRAQAAPRLSATLRRDARVVIRVRDLKVAFGDKVIMDGLDLDVMRGEILGFVGGSGQGKSVLTRTILGLVRKSRGTIEVLGEMSTGSTRCGAARWSGASA